MHRFTPDALSPERKEKTGSAGNDPEEWKKTVIKDKDGNLYLPGAYFFATVKEGARHTKRGRGSIMTVVAATLQIEDDRVYLYNADGEQLSLPDPLTEDADADVYLDIQGVRNPATKGRNVRYRVACKKGWTCSFSVLWDRTIVSMAELQAAVLDAGKLVGVADGRAIGFGRYEVVSFDAEEATT